MSHQATLSVYESCKALSDPAASQMEQYDAMLQCVGDSNATSIDTFFLIYSSSLVFFMQAGFAMLCAGCVQLKNVQNSMLKNLLDACGAALGFWSVGYAFAYGGMDFSDPNKTFIGTENFFLMGVDDLMFWLFQFAFAASSATIVAGTLAERCQMAAYLCYSLTLTGFVYPVVAHSVWSPQGFLNAKAVNPVRFHELKLLNICDVLFDWCISHIYLIYLCTTSTVVGSGCYRFCRVISSSFNGGFHRVDCYLFVGS